MHAECYQQKKYAHPDKNVNQEYQHSYLSTFNLSSSIFFNTQFKVIKLSKAKAIK